MAEQTSKEISLLGWREWVSLPELGIEKIKAKVDTGARSSALHAENIQTFIKEDKTWLRFIVHPIQKNEETKVLAEAPLLEYREVRSSSGHSEERPVVMTSVCLGEITWQIELTLTQRDEMGFRMLLGRQAMKQGFLVNPSKSFLKGKKL